MSWQNTKTTVTLRCNGNQCKPRATITDNIGTGEKKIHTIQRIWKTAERQGWTASSEKHHCPQETPAR